LVNLGPRTAEITLLICSFARCYFRMVRMALIKSQLTRVAYVYYSFQYVNHIFYAFLPCPYEYYVVSGVVVVCC